MSTAWKTGVTDPARLAALDRSGMVGTGTGTVDSFDRLVELAVELAGVSRGCITLVDGSTTTALSAIGFPEGSPRSAPVGLSFCRFVVASGRPLVIDDARVDPRVAGDPAIAAFGATSWAGFPIHDADGEVLGTLCLMDSEPHRWTGTELSVLATLAGAASTEIALRQARHRVEAALAVAEDLRAARQSSMLRVAEHLDQLVRGGALTALSGEALLTMLRTYGDGEGDGEGHRQTDGGPV